MFCYYGEFVDCCLWVLLIVLFTFTWFAICLYVSLLLLRCFLVGFGLVLLLLCSFDVLGSFDWFGLGCLMLWFSVCLVWV